VETPGDVEKGRALFIGTCSSCHKFGAIGKVEVGPPLNGMGAHGRAQLLTQIVDPNREVDPAFWQWNVTTKSGQSHAGVIASENAASLTLRNLNGDVLIKKEEIATRENTRLSLMPEGLEAIGAEALRDILTFMVSESSADDQRFRVVDSGRTPPTAVAPAPRRDGTKP
jgi:putative heme-binding domain-containing protein